MGKLAGHFFCDLNLASPAASDFDSLWEFFPHTPDPQKRVLSPAFLSCLGGGCDLTRELFMWGQSLNLLSHSVAGASLFSAAVAV